MKISHEVARALAVVMGVATIVVIVVAAVGGATIVWVIVTAIGGFACGLWTADAWRMGRGKETGS